MPAFQFLNGAALMPFPSNTLTVDDLPGLGLQDIAVLPIELLAILQREIDERLKCCKAAKARLDGALEVRFATRAAEVRSATGKDTGTVRFDEGDFTSSPICRNEWIGIRTGWPPWSSASARQVTTLPNMSRSASRCRNATMSPGLTPSVRVSSPRARCGPAA